MRVRNIFAALAAVVFAGILLTASDAGAAGGVVIDQGCDTLGATAMADDNGAILACLLKTPGGPATCAGNACKWKPMSGDNDTSPKGTLCGYYVPSYNQTYLYPQGESSLLGNVTVPEINVPCKGVSIKNSCPTGYYAAVLGDYGTPYNYTGGSLVQGKTCVRK